MSISTRHHGPRYRCEECGRDATESDHPSRRGMRHPGVTLCARHLRALQEPLRRPPFPWIAGEVNGFEMEVSP